MCSWRTHSNKHAHGNNIMPRVMLNCCKYINLHKWQLKNLHLSPHELFTERLARVNCQKHIRGNIVSKKDKSLSMQARDYQ